LDRNSITGNTLNYLLVYLSGKSMTQREEMAFANRDDGNVQLKINQIHLSNQHFDVYAISYTKSMLDSLKTTINQTASHPAVLATALLCSVKASFNETSGHPIILCVLFLLIFVHAYVVKSTFSSSKRDAHGKTFSKVYDAASLLSNPDSVLSRDGVEDSIITYETLYAGARKENGRSSTNDSIRSRAKKYQTLVNSFYDLVTDFYVFGWGQSFHFAPRKVGETFNESILRTEHYVALRTHIEPTSRVLDVGCGVGGPMRNIQQLTGADITGVTINQYQVRVGNKYCEQKHISDRCRIYQGDFQDLPSQFAAESFDAAYAIEATCHSPDRR
jgi:hypothetical protein